MPLSSQPDLFSLDESLWIVTVKTGLPVYDFDFRTMFPCRTWRPELCVGNLESTTSQFQQMTVTCRIGVFDPQDIQNDCSVISHLVSNSGIEIHFINSPEEHLRCSRLSSWYPLLEELTPRSKWYDHVPSVAEIELDFRWPIFMKGVRQTSRHQRALSIINGPDKFREAVQASQQDPILRWQPVVCREFVPLRPVEDPYPDRIPSSFEFRTFWWKGQLVGFGRYWWEGKPYSWTNQEQADGLAVAKKAAARIEVPFLVIDIAQSVEGRWIVIECNDGQESGYAGASPVGIWQNIVTIEKGRSR